MPSSTEQGALQIPEPLAEVEREARDLAALAPTPAQVGNIAFGTAGWTDPTLIRNSSFYPPGSSAPAARFAHYVRHFPMVEVDATFYAIPSPSVSLRWVASAPPGFRFDIKAHPVITGHSMARDRLPSDLAQLLKGVRPGRTKLYPSDLPSEVATELLWRFRSFVQPLRDANRLGCVMVQLPPWATATRGEVRRLETLHDRLPELPVAVEFRHPSWLEPQRAERVFDMLRANGFAYVAVDEPDVPGGGVPPVVRATRSDLGIVRFHGHNTQAWRKGASVLQRFNYLYAPHELQPWVLPVRRLAEQAEQVHVVFNNCVRDFAVINAKGLAFLLESHTRAAPSGVE